MIFILSSFFLPRSRPADGGDGDGSGRKGRSCCGEGLLPSWFVFVGWLLVLATSSVAAYFTMLYGLKYGKERSISWLLSTAVSFFQSLLIIQPLKVTWRSCLAVIKKDKFFFAASLIKALLPYFHGQHVS